MVYISKPFFNLQEYCFPSTCINLYCTLLRSDSLFYSFCKQHVQYVHSLTYMDTGIVIL